MNVIQIGLIAMLVLGVWIALHILIVQSPNRDWQPRYKHLCNVWQAYMSPELTTGKSKQSYSLITVIGAYGTVYRIGYGDYIVCEGFNPDKRYSLEYVSYVAKNNAIHKILDLSKKQYTVRDGHHSYKIKEVASD